MDLSASVIRDLPDEERWVVIHTLRKQDMIVRIALHEQIKASKERAEWLRDMADRLALNHSRFIDDYLAE